MDSDSDAHLTDMESDEPARSYKNYEDERLDNIRCVGPCNVIFPVRAKPG